MKSFLELALFAVLVGMPLGAAAAILVNVYEMFKEDKDGR